MTKSVLPRQHPDSEASCKQPSQPFAYEATEYILLLLDGDEAAMQVRNVDLSTRMLVDRERSCSNLIASQIVEARDASLRPSELEIELGIATQ